jgi:hypothetical protein
MSFVNSGTDSYDTIKDVSKKTASKMLGVLNEYQNKSKDIPEDILGYDSNWR